MWIIVAFIDDVVAAVPISWVINYNGEIKCLWPLQDERKKRSRNEIPPMSFEMDGWELHDCAILLNGALYEEFEDALAVEMGDIDINDPSASDRPKLSWKEDEEEKIENLIIVNSETNNQLAGSNASKELSFSDFEGHLAVDRCSSRIDHINQDNLPERAVFVASKANTEKEVLLTNQMSDENVLDSIIQNQGEKKKILVNLMARIYALESALGCTSN